MIAQDRVLVERYLRQDDGTWVLTEFREPTQVFTFGCIDVRIPLAEIYRAVQFPDTATGAAPAERPV